MTRHRRSNQRAWHPARLFSPLAGSPLQHYPSGLSLFPFGHRNHSQTPSPALTPAVGTFASASLGRVYISSLHISTLAPCFLPLRPRPRDLETSTQHGCSISPSQPPSDGGRTFQSRSSTIQDDATTEYSSDPSTATLRRSPHPNTSKLRDKRIGIATTSSNLTISRIDSSPGTCDENDFDGSQEGELATFEEIQRIR